MEVAPRAESWTSQQKPSLWIWFIIGESSTCQRIKFSDRSDRGRVNAEVRRSTSCWHLIIELHSECQHPCVPRWCLTTLAGYLKAVIDDRQLVADCCQSGAARRQRGDWTPPWWLTAAECRRT